MDERLFAAAPINGTAVKVTNQAECGDGEPTYKTRLEDLKKAAARLQEWFSEHGKQASWVTRKRNAKKLNAINTEIHGLRVRLCVNAAMTKNNTREIAQFFVDICKERMTKFEFDSILNEALKRQKEKNCD